MSSFMRCILAFFVCMLTMLTIMPHEATACSCAPPLPPLEAAAASDAVFLAEITAINDANEADDASFMNRIWAWFSGTPTSEERLDPSRDLQVEFTVMEAYKGVEGGSGHLATKASSSLCGYTQFQEGKSFLIYGYHGSEDGLRTNLCTRTTPASNASDEIDILRAEYGA